MTNEEKDLLLKDLCARLYTKTIVNYNRIDGCDYPLNIKTLSNFPEEKLRCYLRPMSSFTADEKKTLNNILEYQYCSDDSCMCESTDWLNAHHFDFRGLIEKGLAIEAPEGMYN